MKFVKIQLEDRVLKVDAPAFVRIRDEHPKADLKPTCVECGQRAFLNDEKGAKGFRVVNLEITARGKRPKEVGFSHYKANDGKDCSLYLANDPRFKGLHQSNEFDAVERERNIAALNTPGVREEIAAVERFFMHRLTSVENISMENREALDKAQKKLWSMKGVAENLWFVGVATPLLFGSYTRQFRNGLRRVEYKLTGEKIGYPIENSPDGESRFLSVPSRIELCWSRRDGKEPRPLLHGGDPTRPVAFEVSPAFIGKIVAAALKIDGSQVQITAASRARDETAKLRAELAFYEKYRETSLAAAVQHARISQLLNPLKKPDPK